MKNIFMISLLAVACAPLALSAQVSTNSEKGQILFACKTGDGGAMLLLNRKGKIILALGESFAGQPKTLFASDHENVSLHEYTEYEGHDTLHKRHMLIPEHDLVINWEFSEMRLRPPEVEIQKTITQENAYGVDGHENDFRIVWSRYCETPSQIKYDDGPVETRVQWAPMPG